MRDDLEQYEVALKTAEYLLGDLAERLTRHPEGIADTLERNDTLDQASAMRLSKDAAQRLEAMRNTLLAAKVAAERSLEKVKEATVLLHNSTVLGRNRSRDGAKA